MRGLKHSTSSQLAVLVEENEYLRSNRLRNSPRMSSSLYDWGKFSSQTIQDWCREGLSNHFSPSGDFANCFRTKSRPCIAAAILRVLLAVDYQLYILAAWDPYLLTWNRWNEDILAMKVIKSLYVQARSYFKLLRCIHTITAKPRASKCKMSSYRDAKNDSKMISQDMINVNGDYLRTIHIIDVFFN